MKIVGFHWENCQNCVKSIKVANESGINNGGSSLPVSIVSLTLVSFKVIISNLIYENFEKGSCMISDIHFGWLAYVEVGGGS